MRAAGATRYTGARPAFTAGPRFARNFAFVWDRPPSCCYCFESILPGERVAWRRAHRPDCLHHVRCRPERAGVDGV